VLAVEAVEREVLTIEGLRDAPMQQAFVENWAFQCGYCTPGFIMNCHALVSLKPDADDSTIENWLQSNICRCTSYQEIKAAVRSVMAACNNPDPKGHE
jgi:carbon-monoxide dehydrogenase small subunit